MIVRVRAGIVFTDESPEEMALAVAEVTELVERDGLSLLRLFSSNHGGDSPIPLPIVVDNLTRYDTDTGNYEPMFPMRVPKRSATVDVAFEHGPGELPAGLTSRLVARVTAHPKVDHCVVTTEVVALRGGQLRSGDRAVRGAEGWSVPAAPD